MKRILMILLTVCCAALSACSGNGGRQQLETAQFEEKQGNKEHAMKLYEEVIGTHAGTANAKIAQERLNVLKGGR